MSVTIKDIARELGVSPATVSLALNGSSMIGQETTRRVKEAAERMGYVRNPYARSLVKGRTGVLGLVVAELRTPFYATLVQDISRAAQEKGYEVSVAVSDDQGATEWANMRRLVQHRVEGLDFSVAAFTNLTQDHLDYHHTMEEYRSAKERLFHQCRRAVLNLDDEAGRWYRERLACPVFTYSENKDQADLTAKGIRLYPGQVEFEAVAREQIQRVFLPIPGGFTIYNALCALSVGLCLGLRLSECAAALRSARGVKGRVEVVPVPTAYTVLIDYAHSPNALENILLTARDFTAGRLICLFGCGGDRDRTKRPIMGGVVKELADLAVVTSDNPRTEDPEDIIRDILAGMEGEGAQIHVEPDRRQAIAWALSQGRPGDVIVLAGKGHETYQEIQGVQYPMDEREIVAQYFSSAPSWERTGNLPAGVV